MLAGMKLTKSAFALSGRLLWWSMLTIGTVTMLILLVSMFDEDVRMPSVDIDVFRILDLDWGGTSLFDIVGYVFSLVGFKYFVGFCYLWTHSHIHLFLTRCGQHILST